jgi:O-antigen ligase
MRRAHRPDSRRLLLPAVVLVLWLGAILAFSGLFDINPAERDQGPPFDAGAAAMARDWGGGPGARLGANLDRSELTTASLDETLSRLEAAGYAWVRFTLPWDEIEPQQGQYDWSLPDGAFAALSRHPALKPVVVLNRSPEWARRPEDAGNPFAPPVERADFGEFAAQIARRYGEQARYYQVWDEPNIAPHWGARPVDPADYLGLLREAAIHLRANDSDAIILLGALAPTAETGGANLSDLAYLDALYELGAEQWFDVVAAQPYGFSEPPDAPGAADRLNFSRAALLHDVMTRHGQGGHPLWATAFGWNALPAGWSGPPSPWGQVTEGEQASYAARALELGAYEWGWLGPMFWAAACPQRPADDPWLGFALCDSSGDPRRSATALALEAARPAVMPPGDHAVDHPAVVYGPGWRVTPSAADPSQTGDRLSLTFNGTGAALHLQGGPFWALYRVWVDGEPANALPLDESGAAYLVLYDPLSELRTVTVARGLPPGEHRLDLVAEGGWGQWALQGFRIDPPEDLPRNLAGWGLLGLALASTAVWAAYAWDGWRRLVRRVMELLDVAAVQPDPLYWIAGAFLVVWLATAEAPATSVAALAGLGLLFTVRPDASLPLVAFSIPFWPRPAALFGLQFSTLELLAWLGLAGLAARALLDGLAGRGWPATPHGLDWPVMAFLAAGLLAMLAADHAQVAMREYRTVFLGGGLVYLLASRATAPDGRPFSPWPMLDGLMLGAIFVSCIAFWQLISGQGIITAEGVWRVRALYGSPNNLALFLDRIVPLALAVSLFGTSRRVPYALAALVTGAACVATFSRGALLLGLPVGIGVVLLGGAWRIRRWWPVGALAGLAAAGAAGLILLARTPRVAGLFDWRSGTGYLRLRLWQAAWRMGLDHPVLGVGPDNFLYAYRTRYVLPDAWEELNLNHPHDVALDLWTRMGILGLVSGVWLVAAAVIRGYNAYRDGSAMVWPIALGLLGGLAASLAHGLIDNSLFLADLMALFMLAAGLFQRFTREGFVVRA